MAHDVSISFVDSMTVTISSSSICILGSTLVLNGSHNARLKHRSTLAHHVPEALSTFNPKPDNFGQVSGLVNYGFKAYRLGSRS